MNQVKLLFIGGVPDDNMTRAIRWTPMGFDLSFPGNCVVPPLFDHERISAMKIYLGGMNPDNQIKLPGRPDVIFNGICDQESSGKAITFAEHFCSRAEADGIPVINHPSLLKKTTRMNSADSFQGLDRILVPKVTYLSAPSIVTIRRMIEQREIPLPAIFRTIGDHNGKNMVLITGPEQLDELGVLPFDGRDYYAIEYVDYANQEGIYRKFRLVKVGDKVFPRHMFSSSRWMIHAAERSENTNDMPEAKQDERAFVTDARSFLGSDLYDQLIEGLNKSDLDYVALDFSLLPDGKAIFFEYNACFNIFTTKHLFPELQIAQERITDALIDLVVDRSRQSKPA